MFLLSGGGASLSTLEEGFYTTSEGLRLPLVLLKPTDLILYNASTNSMQAQIFFDKPIRRVDFTKKVILI